MDNDSPKEWKVSDFVSLATAYLWMAALFSLVTWALDSEGLEQALAYVLTAISSACGLFVLIWISDKAKDVERLENQVIDLREQRDIWEEQSSLWRAKVDQDGVRIEKEDEERLLKELKRVVIDEEQQ